MEKLSHLEVLFMSNNKISSWAEVERLAACSNMRDLLLKGNPLCDACAEAGDWRIQVVKRLPGLKVRRPACGRAQDRPPTRSLSPAYACMRRRSTGSSLTTRRGNVQKSYETDDAE